MSLKTHAGLVIGLIPVYAETGDACRILCAGTDGASHEWTEKYSTETTRKKLARLYHLDLAAQAAELQKRYHRAPPLPMFLPDGRVFVPLKLRLPRVKKDPAYGYLECRSVAKIETGSGGLSQLVLKTGEIILVYMRLSTARAMIYSGLEIRQEYFGWPAEREELQAAFQKLWKFFWHHHS